MNDYTRLNECRCKIDFSLFLSYFFCWFLNNRCTCPLLNTGSGLTFTCKFTSVSYTLFYGWIKKLERSFLQWYDLVFMTSRCSSHGSVFKIVILFYLSFDRFSKRRLRITLHDHLNHEVYYTNDFSTDIL